MKDPNWTSHNLGEIRDPKMIGTIWDTGNAGLILPTAAEAEERTKAEADDRARAEERNRASAHLFWNKLCPAMYDEHNQRRRNPPTNSRQISPTPRAQRSASSGARKSFWATDANHTRGRDEVLHRVRQNAKRDEDHRSQAYQAHSFGYAGTMQQWEPVGQSRCMTCKTLFKQFSIN